MDRLVKAGINAIKFNYPTSDGRDWAKVGAHELAGMDRDGALARALERKLGRLSNSQRFLELGELITPKAFNELREKVAKERRK